MIQTRHEIVGSGAHAGPGVPSWPLVGRMAGAYGGPILWSRNRAKNGDPVAAEEEWAT